MKSRIFVAGLVLMMAVASVWAVAPAAAAGPTTAIVVNAQDTNAGQIVVQSVNAPADGWLLIRSDANGTPGAILGYAPVHQGMNQNVGVVLRTPRKSNNDQVTQTLWATFAADPNAAVPYAAPSDAMFPWMGGYAVAFSSTAAGGPAAPAAAKPVTTGGATTQAPAAVPAAPSNIKIVANAQDTNAGQVMVASINAPADGWLLIRADANGMPGGILGFAPVHQGMNQNVGVDLRAPRNGHNDLVTQTLWATFAADPTAATPNTAPAASFEAWMGGYAIPFSSTAAGGPAAPMAGQPLTTGGTTTQAPAAAPAAAPANVQISAKAQDTNAGQVMVASINAPADGWLIIRRDANGMPGGILGFAPVHQGMNQNVGVDLRTPRTGHNDLVTQTLWATFAADPAAATPNTAPGSSLEMWNGGLAIPFSSTAS